MLIVADEGDAAERVFGLVELAGSAVDDGKGEKVAMLNRGDLRSNTTR